MRFSVRVAVGVVGAGVGGLTVALALRRVGLEVVAYERAAGLAEVGAGVQLGPHATCVLRELGLDEAMREIGRQPAAVDFRRWSDDGLLARQDLGDVEAGYGAPYLTMYRPELVDLLAAHLPSSTIRFDSEVVEVDVAPADPVVRFATGEEVRSELVVGADGIRSRVRDAVVGTDHARFSGMCAYRALVPCSADEASAMNVTLWLGPERHLVAYPVGSVRTWVNIVAVVPERAWAEESWTAPGSAEDLRAQFRGWGPRVTDLLSRVEDPVYRWALYDREPLSRWTAGSVTLLGDACHPMLPFLAQGASQAIGDAVALAVAVREGADRSDALARYEAARRPHTARVQRLSWTNNEVFHLLDGPVQQRRAAEMAGRGGTLATLHWLDANDPRRLVADDTMEQQ